MGVRGLADISEEMQFELQVLEVILDYVTAFMEHLTSDIEAVAYPGLDAIVVKVGRSASALPQSRHRCVSFVYIVHHGLAFVRQCIIRVQRNKRVWNHLTAVYLLTWHGICSCSHAMPAGFLQVTERRLDRMRTVKSRLAHLTSKVETVRAIMHLACASAWAT